MLCEVCGEHEADMCNTCHSEVSSMLLSPREEESRDSAVAFRIVLEQIYKQLEAGEVADAMRAIQEELQ